MRDYGQHLQLTSTVIFGGVGMQPQIDRLRKGVDILVATPGRLLDLHGQGVLDLSGVEILVLDEADRMLDMGFIHDVKKVLALLPANKQSLLFSATFSDDIRELASTLLRNPQQVQVTPRNTTAQRIAQTIYPVGRNRKKDLLAHIIQQNNWNQVLVFTRTKFGANQVADFLNKQGISAMALHGNKSQSARTQALADFKSGALRALVATDIAARGIDIDDLSHVVNYEIPNVPEDYVHRIGRTGRAGAEGQAVSFVCLDEEGFMQAIERFTQLLSYVQPVVDTVMAGREPPVVLASVALGAQMFTMIFLFMIGIALVITTQISKYHGAGDRMRIRRSFQQGLWLTVLLGALTVLLTLAAAWVPQFIEAGEQGHCGKSGRRGDRFVKKHRSSSHSGGRQAVERIWLGIHQPYLRGYRLRILLYRRQHRYPGVPDGGRIFHQ